MNTLSHSDVFVENRLFATLDTTVRTIKLPHSQSLLLSDTVGFIRKLPHHLIASFKSTLAEVVEADMLIHVADISHPLFEDQIRTVQATIEELGAHTKPTILVFNKIDAIKDRVVLNELKKKYKNSIALSASRGINIQALKEKLLEIIDESMEQRTITINQRDYKFISKLYDIGEITKKKFTNNLVKLTIRFNSKRLPTLQKLLAQIGDYKVSS